MKKPVQAQKSNKRNNRRVIMVKSIKGHVRSNLNDNGSFRAQLVNVSFTGAQIYSNVSIPVNAGVDLELDSLDGSHNVTYAGKVVWARKNPMKTMGRYAYGINFDNVDQEQVQFLETNYSLLPIPPQ